MTPAVQQLRMPIDFERLIEFRRLESHCQDHAQALCVWVRLYVELAYLARSGQALGLVPTELAAQMTKELGDASLQALVASGLLAPGPEGLRCARFGLDNPHLAPGAVDMHTLGNQTSRLVRGQKRYREEACQLALLIPPEYFRRADGARLTPVECDRVLLLIRSVDNVLQRPERQAAEFSEGLITDAAAVIERQPDDALQERLKGVLRQRAHPRYQGMTTEKLLQEWTQ